ncbi:MAG: CapA family protein [Caulobacter sp.]|nr:CapA family protein [Caulobacter sp.]
MDRRSFLGGSLALAPASALARARPLRVTLLGQALIEHSPTDAEWPGRKALARRLARADAVFTDLETVIKGPRAQAPTREALTLHAADPTVLAALQGVGVNLVATANNHAFDLGAGGVLDTVWAVSEAGMAFAGSGPDLTHAAAPGYRQTAAGKVALVAFATGKIREGGAATVTRPGVNELRRDVFGAPKADDLARVLDAVAEARGHADVVIVCHHDHDWEPDMGQVPDWQRALARRCVDVGASVFAGHGAPVLQGVERYRGAPLFYGLGNFVFQTEKPVGAYPPPAWRGAIAECEFANGRCVQARLAPIVLNETGLGGPQDLATRGLPRLAGHEEGQVVLRDLRSRSLALGARLTMTGDEARF